MKRIERISIAENFAKPSYITISQYKKRRYLSFECTTCKVPVERRIVKYLIPLCSKCLRDYRRNFKIKFKEVVDSTSELMAIRTQQRIERERNATDRKDSL